VPSRVAVRDVTDERGEELLPDRAVQMRRTESTSTCVTLRVPRTGSGCGTGVTNT